MDHNWHNDALCSNGVSQVRPHLRPADSYITRDELMSIRAGLGTGPEPRSLTPASDAVSDHRLRSGSHPSGGRRRGGFMRA